MASGRIKTGLLYVLVLPRVLFGVMFLLTGQLWLSRDDPAGHLLEMVEQSMAERTPIAPYRLLTEYVVLPYPTLIATLVTFGELASGAALVLGFPARAGAAGAIFLTTTYGAVFVNPFLPPKGNFMLALLLTPLLTRYPYQRLALKAWWRKPAADTSSVR